MDVGRIYFKILIVVVTLYKTNGYSNIPGEETCETLQSEINLLKGKLNTELNMKFTEKVHPK